MFDEKFDYLLVKKDGQIFINAAGGDCQENVVRRAARIALKMAEMVNYQLINRNEYNCLMSREAKKIMTPRAWIEEMGDDISGPLSLEEIKSLTSNTKRKIVAELKKE